MRIVLLIGDDGFLLHEYLDRVRAVAEEANPGADMVRFDGETASVADVLDECRTFGLMTPHKVVVVDQAEELVKGDEARRAFERYAEAPAETATLVLRARTWHPGKLDKLIRGVGAVVKCDPPPEWQAVNWARKRCEKEYGKAIGREAATALVARLGADLARIDSELGKLAAAAGEAPEITVELIEELVGLTREQEVWGLQSAILTGDPEAALSYLRRSLEVSRESPVLVAYACCDLARKLHAGATGRAGGMGKAEVARELRLWGESKEPILHAVGTLDVGVAARLLHESVEVDSAGKSGRGDPVRNLEGLVVRFASAFA